MSLNALGKDTSPVEVTHISSHGVWLLAGSQELFMSYDDFPWFKEVASEKSSASNSQRPATSTGLNWTLISRSRSFSILSDFP